MYNAWGGSVEIEASVDNDADSRNLEIDRASVKSLDASQQSWLLGETERSKKNKFIDLGCVQCSKRLFFTLVCVFLTFGIIAGLVSVIVKTAPRKHHVLPVVDNYTQALHHALSFFDAQKSGHLPKGLYNISYRGDSGMQDGLSPDSLGGYPDLVGGYYDAGDNIKFGFPQSFAMTVLSWSVIEYRAKYEAAGELDHIREIIKWGTDYMLKTFNSSAPPGQVDKIWSQVGQGSDQAGVQNDHTCWNSPEEMNYPRPCYPVSQGADLAAEMAAALAAASIVFRDNVTYSSKLLFAARSVYEFATDRGKRNLYVQENQDALQFYKSSGYRDEILWGGAWLYYATGNVSYLDYVTNEDRYRRTGVADTRADYYGVFSWDNKLIAAQVLLTRLRILQGPGYPYEQILKQYNNHTDIVMCSYLPDYASFNRTRDGLIILNHNGPGTLFYTVNAAFLAALYADYLEAADIPGWYCGSYFQKIEELRTFARYQIDYILGKNSKGMSYVVGFGNKYPLQVHHRAASTPTDKTVYGCQEGFKWLNSTQPNPHVLVGALVGGPTNGTDAFKDERRNFNTAEPTLHGNAGLVAALVALSEVDSPNTPTLDMNSIFAAIPPMYPTTPPPPPPYAP